MSLIDEENGFNLCQPECVDTSQAACHIYYPSADSEAATDKVANIDDPLADTADWSSYEQVNVDDELLTLEDMTPANVSEAFSIVDPLQITESELKVEPKCEFDFKPSITQVIIIHSHLLSNKVFHLLLRLQNKCHLLTIYV